MLKKSGFVAVVIATMAGFLALMACSSSNQAPPTNTSSTPAARTEKPAPDFTLPLFNGGEFVLREHLGKPVVINFWSST